MKKLIGLLIGSILLSYTPVCAQKILLKIAAVTAAAGEDVKAVEFKTESTMTWIGSGSGQGKATIHELLIKKTNNTSTNELFKRVTFGTILPTVILEYYNASNVLYFTITLRQVFVTNFFFLSPECPTCLKLEHQVAFVPKQIETTDAVTGITFKFDVVTNSSY